MLRVLGQRMISQDHSKRLEDASKYKNLNHAQENKLLFAGTKGQQPYNTQISLVAAQNTTKAAIKSLNDLLNKNTQT